MISIIVCTYNRSEFLRQTLQTLAAQVLTKEEPVEIVVVDNNSADSTPQVVEAFSLNSRWPVRYVRESKQGVGHARNAGVAASRGDVMAYVDDDVLVTPHWLEGLSKAFRETDAGVVGGRIDRLWECEIPDWFSEEIGGPIIDQNFGDERKWMTDPKFYMLTANLAFRREVFEKCGVFLGELGRRGNVLIGGEEPEMFQRLHQAGIKIMYEPSAVVKHRVEKDRLTKAYMRRWFYDIGRTRGHQMEWKPSHCLTILPGWQWKETLKAFARRIKSFGKSPAECFASEVWLKHHLGVFQERLIHWLPFNWGKRACVFEVKTELSK